MDVLFRAVSANRPPIPNRAAFQHQGRDAFQNPRNQRIRSLGDCLIEVTIMLRRSEACVCLFRLDQPFDSKQYLRNLVDDDKGACSRKVDY
jgi:hypothetical protein